MAQLGLLASIDNNLRRFLGWYTQARAANLDNLDVAVSTRQSSATALTQYNATLAALVALAASAVRRKMIIIDTAGVGEFIVPADVRLLRLSMCGGGGGGAVGVGSAGENYASGGSGASIINLPMVVTPGQAIAYNVGAGGALSRNQSAGSVVVTGTDGGATTFGSYNCPGGGRAGCGYNQFTYEGTAAPGGGGTHSVTRPEDWKQGGYTPVFTLRLAVDGGFFYNGQNGCDKSGNNSIYMTVTPLSYLNDAGAGGGAERQYNNAWSAQNGRNGVIVLEMETSS